MTLDIFKKYLHRIHIKVKSDDFRLFLVFVAIASLIWFVEQFRNEYTITIDYPIDCHNIPDRYSISDKEKPSIQVTLRGDGLSLMSLKESDLVFSVNIARTNKHITEDNICAYIVPRRHLSDIKKSLNDDNILIMGVSPDTLLIPLLSNTKKEVPVAIKCNVRPMTQHYITSAPKIEPSTIFISGTNDIIDKIDTLYTEVYSDITISDTTHMEFKLDIPMGVAVSNNKVNVTYYAELFTEKSIDIPISGINIPEGYTFKPFPPTVRATFTIGISHFDKVTEKDFIIMADLQNVTPGSGTSRAKLRLSTAPEDVRNVTYTPIFIEYLLEKNKIEKKQ